MIGPALNDWTMVRLANSDTQAMDVPTKVCLFALLWLVANLKQFCKTCNIWRPPRTHHCRIGKLFDVGLFWSQVLTRADDSCVEGQDHHCVWLNQCVGRRNYRYFFSFVFTATILSLYLSFACLGQCLQYHKQHHVSLAKAIDANRVPFAMFIYGLLAGGYPLSLLIYHVLLTGTGQTTREYLNARRFPKKDRHLPFDQGSPWKNWLAVLGRPKGPSYLQFKRHYEEGDQRMGLLRGGQRPDGLDVQNGGHEMTSVHRSFEGPHSQHATN